MKSHHTQLAGCFVAMVMLIFISIVEARAQPLTMGDAVVLQQLNSQYHQPQSTGGSETVIVNSSPNLELILFYKREAAALEEENRQLRTHINSQHSESRLAQRNRELQTDISFLKDEIEHLKNQLSKSQANHSTATAENEWTGSQEKILKYFPFAADDHPIHDKAMQIVEELEKFNSPILGETALPLIAYSLAAQAMGIKPSAP